MLLNSGTPTVTTYNLANQISNAGFTYDNAGNLTNDGTAAYTYDALNRTTVRGGTTYGYNGDGTLVSQATSGVTTRYTQDLAAPLMLLRGASPRAPDQGNPRRFASCPNGCPCKRWEGCQTLAGRFAPAPPIEGTEAGSPKPSPAKRAGIRGT